MNVDRAPNKWASREVYRRLSILRRSARGRRAKIETLAGKLARTKDEHGRASIESELTHAQHELDGFEREIGEIEAEVYGDWKPEKPPSAARSEQIRRQLGE